MAVFSFEAEELEGIAPISAQEHYLKKFGFIAPPLPSGYSHEVPANANANANTQDATGSGRMTPPPSPGRAEVKSLQTQTGFGASANGGEQINHLVAKRKTKKRIQPSFVGALSGSVPSAGTAKAPATAARPPTDPVPSTSSAANPFRGLADLANDNVDRDVEMFAADANMDVPIAALETGRAKRKTLDGVDDRIATRPRTLGGDRMRENVAVREIAGVQGALWGEQSSVMGRLQAPPVLTYVKATVEGGEDVFEGRNAENGGMWGLCCWIVSLTHGCSR